MAAPGRTSEPHSDIGGYIRLPRWNTLLLRNRARRGHFVGSVSTGTLIEARKHLLIALVVALYFGCFVLVIAFSSSSAPAPDVREQEVASVLTPAELTSADHFQITFTDGSAVVTYTAPDVAVGDVLLAERGPVGEVLSISKDGESIIFDNTTETDDDGEQEASLDPVLVMFVVVAVVFFVLFALALIMLPFFAVTELRHTIRNYLRIKRDLDAPLETVQGRYTGSWMWRGLWTREVRPSGSHRLAGFPVAIEEQPGELSWFGAPADAYAEVVDFEAAIAAGNRQVVLHVHPNSRAIASLEAADGSAQITFDRENDEMRSSSGLSFKVSRWRRSAHLPDR